VLKFYTYDVVIDIWSLKFKVVPTVYYFFVFAVYLLHIYNLAVFHKF